MDRRVVFGVGAVVVAGLAAYFYVQPALHQQVGQAVDAGLAQFETYLPPGTTITHDAIAVNPLTQAITLHNVVLRHGGVPSISADSVTVAQADPQALRDVFDAAAYPNGQPAWGTPRLLIGDFSAQGVRFLQPGQNSALQSFSLHHLSGRPFMVPPTPDNTKSPAFQVDVARALAVESLVLQGVTGQQAKPASTTHIGSLSITGYQAGQLGGLMLRDLVIDAQGRPKSGPVHVTLADFSVKGLDAHAALAAAQTGQMSPQAMGQISYGRMDIHEVAFSVGNGPSFKMHDLYGDQSAPDADGVRKVTGALHGIVMDLGSTPVPPSGAAAVAAFGMRAITMDIEGSGRRKDGGAAGDFSEDIILHDLGTLHMEAAYSGYVRPATMAPAQSMQALQGIVLDHAILRWDDKSLVDRIFAVAAVQMHATPELVKAQLATPILSLGVLLPEQPDAADQVSAFINHPKSLTINLNPPQKVTFGEVGRAPVTQRAQMLGVKIIAN